MRHQGLGDTSLLLHCGVFANSRRLPEMFKLKWNAALLTQLRWGGVCGWFLVTVSAATAATDAQVSTRLAGSWLLSSPRLSCSVTLEITTGGMATFKEGSRVTTWKLRPPLAAQDKSWKITVQPAGGQGVRDCTYPRYVPENFTGEIYVRFLSEDRRMALCTTDDIGGCSRWFDRVGDPALHPAVSPAIRVEHAIYQAIHEHPELFELLVKDPLPLLMVTHGASHFRQMQCPNMFAWDVGGSFQESFGELRVAVCPDGTEFARIGRDAVNSGLARSLPAPPVPPGERLRYGISFDTAVLPDGARMYSYPAALAVGVQLNTVIWLAAGQKRAVVLQLIGMSTCERPHPYVDGAFCKNRSEALRQAAVEIAQVTGPKF